MKRDVGIDVAQEQFALCIVDEGATVSHIRNRRYGSSSYEVNT